MVELDLSGRTLGGYRVGQLLGRGAFGWVYQAVQLSLDRTVALKVLDPVVARNPDAARRFDREGRSAAALDHPAVVDVYHAGESDGLHFLAMRMIDGTALDEVLRRGPPRTPDALAMLGRIASALDHAHARGVVHRDVKPANILLEQGDPRRAWLGDFGISVSVRATGALSTAAVGTAFYMAPEQVEPRRIGPASDQYSLACVAYETLTGRPPFSGDDVMAVLLSHRAARVPPAGSPRLDAVFARALAKQPEQRYRTVAEFVHELGSAIGAGRAMPATTPAPVPAPVRATAATTVAGRAGRGRWLAGVSVLAVLATGGAITAAVLLGGDRGGGPDSWTSISGPGPVRYEVPPGWQVDRSGPVVTFTASGERKLMVGTDTDGDAEPMDDLKRLYACTGGTEVAVQIAGFDGASCAAAGDHVTILTSAGTTVRFVFSPTVPEGDRDKVLGSLHVTE